MGDNLVLQRARSRSSLAAGFIDSIRECMPDTAAVREALGFTRLVLDNPRAGGKLASLHTSLWRLITLDPGKPLVAAGRIRQVVSRVLSDCDHSSSGQVLEMALSALSLRFDDRPSVRILNADLGMMAAGRVVIGIDDMVPTWVGDESRPCLMSPGPVYGWVARHVAAACDALLPRLEGPRAIGGSRAFGAWISIDLESALLALRMQYCMFKTAVNGASLGSHELVQDFDESGKPIWEALQRALERLPEALVSARCLRDREWHVMARSAVRLAIGEFESEATPIAFNPNTSMPLDLPSPGTVKTESSIGTGAPSLVVCRSPIIEATDRYDNDEVNRHKVLEQPLPLAAMPAFEDLVGMQLALAREFPWAVNVLATIFDDLLGRAKLGIRVFGIPPTLLVGSPGSGKSRLAGRLADVFGLPRMDLSLGGTSDSKVLAGTARGWGSGKPSDLATFLAVRKSASALVLLDELDKATEGYRTGVGLQSYLLGMLEPETARRLMDVFLKTECDFSGVMWIGTANTLSGILAPLRSRLRILMMRQPLAEHFKVIAEHVLADLAKSWTLEREVLPTLKELELPWDRIASARQVRAATEGAVMRWARHLQRH